MKTYFGSFNINTINFKHMKKNFHYLKNMYNYSLIQSSSEMPRRKVTRAAKSRKTSRVSDGNDLEISNKAEREKLETYLKDFDTRGKGFKSIHKHL